MGTVKKDLPLIVIIALLVSVWVSHRYNRHVVPTSPTSTLVTKDTSDSGITQLQGAGATFPAPLYSQWFATYHKLHPKVAVNYQPIGSGGGIQQLMNHTVDFGASDAPLNDSEKKDMPGVLHLPTVGGAVAVAYNIPGYNGIIRFTPDVLAGIFSGKITRWNDPLLTKFNDNGFLNLPNLPIVVLHRSDGSGTTFIFTNYLGSVSPAWKDKVGVGKSVSWPVGLGGKGNAGVAGLLEQKPGSIGYVELAYAVQNHLSYGVVRNKDGDFVEPSVKSTVAAIAASAENLHKDVRSPIVNPTGKDSYPICGLTYILVYQKQVNPVHGKLVMDLLDWCVHDGQKMATGLMYAPLPPPGAKLDEQQIALVRKGL